MINSHGNHALMHYHGFDGDHGFDGYHGFDSYHGFDGYHGFRRSKHQMVIIAFEGQQLRWSPLPMKFTTKTHMETHTCTHLLINIRQDRKDHYVAVSPNIPQTIITSYSKLPGMA